MFNTAMSKSSLRSYSDAYILVKETRTIVGGGYTTAAIAADRNNKQVGFKNSALFTNCISKINNSEKDNAEGLDIVMPMYNLLEYSNYYTKKACLWKYVRDEPNNNITDSQSFKLNQDLQITLIMKAL